MTRISEVQVFLWTSSLLAAVSSLSAAAYSVLVGICCEGEPSACGVPERGW